ncbi:MAG TPA: hypothetical protein ENI62_02650 [Gammaproteobacteria bacterium]|nr:hypothetical protein [Gammaproteobacteria bacterium]
MDALMETHTMDQEAIGAFCRQKGIFPHHLKQWRKEDSSGCSGAQKSVGSEACVGPTIRPLWRRSGNRIQPFRWNRNKVTAAPMSLGLP